MSFFIFSALMNAFIAGLLGFVILLKNRKELVNKLFFSLSASVVFWSIFYWQWLSSDNAFSALFFIRFLSIGSLFIPVFYFHWILVFVGLNKQKGNLIKFLYFIIFIILAFSFSDLFIEKVGPKLAFSFWPTPGVLYSFYLIFIYLGLIIYSLVILWNQYKVSAGVKKSSIKYIIISSLIGFSGGATNFFLWYDIPILPYGNILVSLYPIALAIASLRYGLFNIKVITTELLVFVIWVFLLTKIFLTERWNERIIDGSFLILVILFGILIIKSVLKEVEQRERMEKLAKDLEAANKKLVELDEAKAGMYSFVSHQIKAPLAIAKGFAQLIADGDYGKITKKTKEAADNIKSACNRLLNMTETFLDAKRIEEGRMDYNFREMNIAELTKAVVSELDFLARQKGLQLTFEIKAGNGKFLIKGDEQRLRQVIQNLIENSIKYTTKGWVSVELDFERGGGNSVLVAVSDSGMGISKEFLPKLFNKFARAESAKVVKGTGLGLYIAKEIIKAHGGEIWVESEGENKGATFYARLPALAS